MTEVKEGDLVTLTVTGTVRHAAIDELNIQVNDHTDIYLETSGTWYVTELVNIEVHEPPKIPTDAEVIRWAVELAGDYVYRYANITGHPGNGVWWIPDTAVQIEVKTLTALIGDADVEVLKRLAGDSHTTAGSDSK